MTVASDEASTSVFFKGFTFATCSNGSAVRPSVGGKGVISGRAWVRSHILCGLRNCPFGRVMSVSAQSGMRVREGLLPPRYRESERLAGGGMGEVYRAIDASLDRTVAIKLLAERDAADGDLRERLTREALAAGRLTAGPNTVTIYDVGEWDGRPYIVMAYLPGGSLEEQLRRDGSVSPRRALAWLAEAAAALDHAHAKGVVHRDVKPANLLLDGEGRLHVADFGIASAAGLASMTQTGTVLGTAGYLAPEQAEGKTVTAAADRYALAVVGFELLTGGRPFRRDSLTAEAAAHLSASIPRASARNPQLPRRADAVFERALAKDPEARFPSCMQFVRALEAAFEPAAATIPMSAPTRAAAASPPACLKRKLKRRLLPLLLVGVALAGAALAAVLASGHGHAALQPTLPTVTAPAKTVTVTEAASTQAATTQPTTSTPTTTSGASLNQQAQTLLQAGNYQAALPLLQHAVQLLNGNGTTDEANADYNLAYTITRLGSCDGVVPLLDRAQAILGSQPQVDQLTAICTGPPGHRPGHGHGNGNGD